MSERKRTKVESDWTIPKWLRRQLVARKRAPAAWRKEAVLNAGANFPIARSILLSMASLVPLRLVQTDAKSGIIHIDER